MLKTSLCLLLKKYRETGSVVDRPRVRIPKKLKNQHYGFIDQCLENDMYTHTHSKHSHSAIAQVAGADSQLLSRVTRVYRLTCSWTALYMYSLT